MFANKLVALTDRYKKTKTIAGRDLYDIHHFFLSGLKYEPLLIKERTSLETTDYLKFLHQFINKHVTETVINEDLNALLPEAMFQKIRKNLKTETLTMLQDEINSLTLAQGRLTSCL